MESKNIKILAIDDNNDNLISIKALIKEIFSDAIIFTALNGARGIELAINENPDVILLDIIMPEMDGFEVCRKMKEDHRLCDTPVVFVTSIQENKGFRILALECGAEAFLSKPIDRSELTAQIRAMVKIKTANIEKNNEKARLESLLEKQTRELKNSYLASLNLLEDVKKENEARLISDENFRNLYDNAPVGLYRTTPKGEILLANHALVDMLGYSSFDELATRNLENDGFEPTYNRKQFKKQIEKNGEIKNLEAKWVCKNGKVIIVKENAKAKYDSEGKVQYYDGTVEDITAQKKTEQELKKNEERFRNISTSISDISYSCKKESDGEYRIDWVFGAYEKISGYRYEELIAMKCWGVIVVEEDFPLFKAHILDVKPGSMDMCEMRIKNKNGQIIWINVTSKCVKQEDTGVEIIFGGIIDITERKNIEISLQKSEEHFRFLFEQASDGIFIADQKGNYLDVNIVGCQMFGYSKEEFENLTIFDILTKDDVKWIKNEMDIFLKDNIIKSEWQFKRKDESVFTGEVVIKKLIDGKLQAFVRDITKRKAEEDLLRASEEKFRELANLLPQIVFESDAKGHLTYVNKQANILLGYPEDFFFTGLNSIDFYIPEDRIRAVENIKRRLSGNQFGLTEYSMIRKDGSTFPALIYSNPIIKDNKPVGLRGIIVDITDRKQTEELIKKSELLYRNLFENMTNGFAYCKMEYKNNKPFDFTYLNVNKTFESLTGLKNVEGKKISEVIPGIQDIDPEIIEIYGRIASTGKTEKIERYTKSLKMWFSISVYSPEKGYFIALFDVITERKLAEKALEESERKYRLITDKISDVVWVMDLKGKSIFVSPSIEKFTGYSVDEYLAQTIETRFTPDSAAIALETFKNEVNKYIHAESRPNDYKKNMVLDYLCKDGSIKTGEVRIVANLDDNNNCIGLHGVTRDITERKQAEATLKESEEKFRSITEQIDGLIGISDDNGFITYASSSSKPLFYIDPEEMCGHKFIDFVDESDISEAYEVFRNLSAGGSRAKDLEYKMKRKDGSLFYGTLSGSSFKSGKKDGTLVIINDITRRKETEQELIKAKEKAEENDRLKSTFLANMSHEIRTPMNGILGFAWLLKQQKLTGEEQQEYIKMIEKSGERMLNIINDIISITKVESGQLELSIADTNINEQMEFIYTFFKPETKQNKLLFSFKNGLSEKDAYIKTDRELIYAILTNLVKNAVKFTPNGSIRFGYIKKDNFLQFFVKDTGIGISETHKDLIFERFRQANESLSRNYEGTGLGLSISKAYIEKLGGKIWLKSELGKGSVFYFTIPYIPAAEEEVVVLTKQLPVVKEVNPVKKLKILIAEDDKASEMLLTMDIKELSKEIIKVMTGYEAIEACRNNPDIDLILMDIQMPEMNGHEATRQIRKFNKKVIIIAQTAFALSGDREKAIKAGCNDYITKPINSELLIALINKYFQKIKL